jgi:hypothetical protein
MKGGDQQASTTDNMENIQWQITARKRIQELMLRQYRFLENHPGLPKDQDFYQMVRSVQIAYSLWRSAFLTDVLNDRNLILQKSKEFLGKILINNAIGFQDEFGNRDLTVAYYNNNAKYRLERDSFYDPNLAKEHEFVNLNQIRVDDDTERRKQKEIWELCFDALKKGFDVLESRVEQATQNKV